MIVEWPGLSIAGNPRFSMGDLARFAAAALEIAERKAKMMGEIAPVDPREDWDEPSHEDDCETEPPPVEDWEYGPASSPTELWEIGEMYDDVPTKRELPPIDDESEVW